MDVAPEAIRLLVERLAHDAEVLLGRVGAAESLGGGAVRNIVEQRLRRAADDGDHVGALLGGGFRLLHVVVDIAGGDDDVLPGRAIERSDAKVALALLALVDARLQLPDRGARLRAHLLAELLVLGGGKRWQLFGVRGDPLDRLQRILARRRAQGAAQPVRRVPLQHAGVAQAVDHQIRQRSTAGTGAGDPEQPQDGALDGDRGVATDERLHAHRGAAGELARAGDLLSVDEELRHGDGCVYPKAAPWARRALLRDVEGAVGERDQVRGHGGRGNVRYVL